MGQRLVAPDRRRLAARPAAAQTASPATLCIFPTELGWFGLAGAGETVRGLSIGHLSAEEVRSAAADGRAKSLLSTRIEGDWNPPLRRALERFARGMRVDFDGVAVDLEGAAPFHHRVLAIAQHIPYGQRVSYRELAMRAGNPKAARAVGAAMKSNPLPIIIPCHRVVASGGSIGGFSAPQGIDLKRRLLEMESAAMARD